MPRVGPYAIPFPCPPYPLQEHAVTAIRHFLEQHRHSSSRSEIDSTREDGNRNGASNVVASTPSAAEPVMAVLESPTGTGKSQMLLNSVLSYLYEPCEAATSLAFSPPACAPAVEKDVESLTSHVAVSPGPFARPEPGSPMTLDAVLRQRQREEDAERARREQHMQARVQRRQLRHARRLMQQQQQHPPDHGKDDGDFLLTQLASEWYAEQQSAGALGHRDVMSYSGDGSLPAQRLSLSSSSFSDSSASEDDHDDDEANDPEADLGAELATILPLRKPKVFVASRTHTQLQQLMEDLRRTAFAQHPIRVQRPCGGERTTIANAPPQQQEQPRRLTAVHVAGRPHLCLNNALLSKAGGNSERLGFLCREAMRFERSKEGKQRRRRHQQEQQQFGRSGVGLRSNSTTTKTLPDLEDMDLSPIAGAAAGGGNEDKGCLYCVESHLRALLTYLRDQETADHLASVSGAAPSASPTSLYSMDLLRHLGSELQACPYLATRLLLRGTDVAFIPYGYLLDEGQRTALLGGVTTNPVTAAEAGKSGCDAPRISGTGSSVAAASPLEESATGTSNSLSYGDGPRALPAVSLGAVLYQRRQRVATAAALQRRRQQDTLSNHPRGEECSKASREELYGGHRPNDGGDGRGSDDTDDVVWRAMAHTAPPSFKGDILVFDEAHNIAEQCRAISSISIAPWHLQLSQILFEKYLARYETRLLTRNKQRLRELIRLLSKLSHFCCHAGHGSSSGGTAASSASTSSTPTGGNCETSSPVVGAAPSSAAVVVLPFHTFLFQAGIDSIDVFVLLAFLVDTQLLGKLHSFAGFCLEAERADAAAAARTSGEGRANDAPHVAVPTRRVSDSGSRKRVRDPPTREKAEAHHQLHLSDEEKERCSKAPLSTFLLSRFASLSAAECASPERGPATVVTTPPLALVDSARLRALAVEALQKVEGLLYRLLISDATSTRVLWVPAGPFPSTASPLGPGSGDGTFKLLQLEPGLHTFAPLAQQAAAVVLAGGTMQPLAFTCGPLLQMQHGGDEGSSGGEKWSMSTSGSPERSSATGGAAPSPTRGAPPLPIHLISEGHVVPSSSVQVWALGSGPSGVRLEFSQHTLGSLRRSAVRASSDAPRSSSSLPSPHLDLTPQAHRMLTEVGCTLLNLSRVLPPAGAICFFTSYDVMDAVVAVLQGTDYFRQIDEVKRIFCETRGGSGGGYGSAAAMSSASTDVLRAYQDWVVGDGRVHRGALLFAVMGGRLSEGINFEDDLGRAVIVLGMPYANPTDVELQMNLQHIARTRMGVEEGATSPLSSTTTTAAAAAAAGRSFTSAAEWGLYTEGMMRTVNQCIGRCIRHANDYAVIVLLDARYTERPDVRRRVSAWLQPSLRVATSFGRCFSGVRDFFSSH